MAGPRLVVIDDEMEFTKAVSRFFSDRGYEVSVALTGPSGLELVDTQQPDVMLLDLKLPGLDGDEILRRLRTTHPKLKVIIITAYNDGGKTKDRLLSLGAFAYFDKPLPSLRALADTVKQAVAVDA